MLNRKGIHTARAVLNRADCRQHLGQHLGPQLGWQVRCQFTKGACAIGGWLELEASALLVDRCGHLP